MTSEIDWVKVHPAMHRKYTGERSPRSGCPICKELYLKRKAEKTSPTTPAQAVQKPAEKVKPPISKVQTTLPHKFKGLTLGKVSLSAEELNKIYKNAIVHCRIPERIVNEILLNKKELLEKVIGTLTKVYGGLGQRLLAEVTIAILAYSESINVMEQAPTRHTNSRRKK